MSKEDLNEEYYSADEGPSIDAKCANNARSKNQKKRARVKANKQLQRNQNTESKSNPNTDSRNSPASGQWAQSPETDFN